MPARKKRPGKHGTIQFVTADKEFLASVTPEERLLMAIFGRDDGSTYEDTIRRMRAEAEASQEIQGP